MRRVSIANCYPGLRFSRAAVGKLIRTLDAHYSQISGLKSEIFPGELSLVFLTDHALAKLHADFLADPSPTDVITFAGDPATGSPAGAGAGGEICVSVDAALRYARKVGRRSADQQNRSRRGKHDFSEELTLYLVHGWLHLAGHDDLVPAGKRRMRAAEQRALRLLRAADGLPVFRLA